MCKTKAEDVAPDMRVTDMKMAELAKKPVAHPHFTPVEWVMFFSGVALMILFLPLTVSTVSATVLWDALDRGFMGKPQDGIVMSFARWVNVKTAWFGERFTRQKSDGFFLNVVLLLGVAIPSLFFASLWYTLQNGFSFKMCFAYHLLRLGPYFMNFAYVYTSCHKECHAHLGIFKDPYNKVMRYVFNWWIGLFYGVLPSSFAIGHAINHHKYNNGPRDVISTGDKPRDNWMNFICFIPRQGLYAINVSTVIQFIQDGDYMVAFNMNFGTMYYAFFAYLLWQVDPYFSLFYFIFPLGENVLLLSCISWCWHSFLNADDPEDDYVGSTTILNGPINVLGEDYHVIHHRYPGLHWSDHHKFFEKDFASGKYHEGPASMFTDTHVFELFFLIMLAQYDEIAKRMVDPRGKWTHADKINALKVRLRTCWWGPRRNLTIKLTGKEIRKSG